MIGISVTGAKELAAKLERAKATIPDRTLAGMRTASGMVQRALMDEMSHPSGEDPFWGKTGAQDDGLYTRTGKTKGSLTGGGSAFRVGTTVTAVVGSPEESLKRHEEGGTFRGTSPKGFARIPTALAQTPGGDEKGEFKGKSLRDVPGVFLKHSLGGRLWAVRQASKNRLDFLYLLVQSYTLRPRRIFARTRDKETPRVKAILEAEMTVAVKEAGL